MPCFAPSATLHTVPHLISSLKAFTCTACALSAPASALTHHFLLSFLPFLYFCLRFSDLLTFTLLPCPAYKKVRRKERGLYFAIRSRAVQNCSQSGTGQLGTTHPSPQVSIKTLLAPSMFGPTRSPVGFATRAHFCSSLQTTYGLIFFTLAGCDRFQPNNRIYVSSKFEI